MRACRLQRSVASVVACVLTLDRAGRKTVGLRVFGTYWKELQRLRHWLWACKVRHVAMESTGVYWKPVWNIVEGNLGGNYFDLLNPEKTKRKLARRIERLGYEVVLKPKDPSAHENTTPS